MVSQAKSSILGVLVVLFYSVPSVGQSQSLVEDMNPLLGPEYAQWLVGAMGRIASKSERDEFHSLSSDKSAAEFIQRFWAQPEHDLMRDIYEARGAEADRAFTESMIAGRRTDRGTIYILYGPPKEVEYEEFRNVEDPDVLIWRYDRKQSGKGLDGKKPGKLYRFVKVGDVTRLFQKGGRLDPEEQRRRNPLRRP